MENVLMRDIYIGENLEVHGCRINKDILWLMINGRLRFEVYEGWSSCSEYFRLIKIQTIFKIMCKKVINTEEFLL